jgi:hypothetical protein
MKGNQTMENKFILKVKNKSNNHFLFKSNRWKDNPFKSTLAIPYAFDFENDQGEFYKCFLIDLKEKNNDKKIKVKSIRENNLLICFDFIKLIPANEIKDYLEGGK